jgi:hypothetical protein
MCRPVVAFVICLYPFIGYTASTIYLNSGADTTTPQKVRHQRDGKNSVGLAFSMLVYSAGSLRWLPLSELPHVGRNPAFSLHHVHVRDYVDFYGLVTSFSGFSWSSAFQRVSFRITLSCQWQLLIKKMYTMACVCPLHPMV